MPIQPDKILFYDMFPVCREADGLPETLESAVVVKTTVDEANSRIELTLRLTKPISPVDQREIEGIIAREYKLKSVTVKPVYAVKPTVAVKTDSKGRFVPTVIMGRVPRGKKVKISELELSMGNVVIEGEVFAVSSRELQKRGAWVLTFDITDHTGSIRVSKYLSLDGRENVAAIVSKIKTGMALKVSGRLELNRYEGNDMTLGPTNIVTAERKTRLDTADTKRVELHLHTQMSMMDAVTDVKQVIKRAIEWGHPAIAITDHGVVQSFPDAMSAAGDKIKILYGLEGYYINDVDERPGILGDIKGLGGEIVVFDIETTGLVSFEDHITEIGAVKIRGGEVLDRFQTFVNPGVPIPYNITELTGISDSDVAGAPGEADAVRAFLDFAGNLPLAAHNAAFDVGFIDEVCVSNNIPFTPRYIDTLELSRALLTDIRSHRLNTVAQFLGLPDFKHHRAVNDAETTGLILEKLIAMLEAEGRRDVASINELVLSRRKNQRTRHIIIFAKNQAGIKNLYTLVTKSHLEHFKRNPVIPKSLLMKYRDGLIIGSACEAGEIFSGVERNNSRFEMRALARFYDYLEIQPLCNNRFMLKGDRPRAKNEEHLKDINRRIVALARETGVPVVATGDVHFLDPNDEIFRKVLLCAKQYDNALDEVPIYFRTTQEMLAEFAYLGEETAYEVVVTNTRLVADMCDTLRPLPPAKKLFAPKIENSAEDLKKLVQENMTRLYGENPPDEVTKRTSAELTDILKRNYDVIYMSAQKLVSDSLDHGYLVGSRGSVGSSIVAYLAGITEVNSLPPHYRCDTCKHCEFVPESDCGCGADMPDKTCPVCGAQYKKEGFDIPFETFLGFGGDKVPDIDLNFSGEYQADAHKFTNSLFGSDHVYRAGTIGTIAEKTAFGYVKKYSELLGKTFSRAEENRLAQGCVGVKRTTGQHPGGLVIIPQDMDITDFCPAQHPADDSDAGVITTHFDYHCMEDNLLKLDELGHDDPTMIKMLEDLTGINAREVPLDDPETMNIFSSPEPLGLKRGDAIIGETGSIGIPEFGTPFTRQMLCDTTPNTFDTLVRLSGFSHGTDVWLGNSRDIIMNGVASINATIGCRDDIMQFLISKGMDEQYAFRVMESVRKGKGLPEGAESDMRDIDVPDWYIGSCKKIKYLFPKAHAVAYVMMAFRIAWFKVHRPLEFYSAYFYRRSQKDSFDAEYMTRGIDLARAKIRELQASQKQEQKAKDEDLLTTLEACYEFYLRGFTFTAIDLFESDPVKFTIVGENALRPPFVAVSGLGETAARDLARQRVGREFISIEDIGAACPKVSKTHIEQLKSLGVFRDLPDASQLSLF